MIDWNRIEELRNDVGEDAVGEVLELFLRETDELTARLEAGKPSDTLESDLHFLKGAALNLGFESLAARCEDGETCARAGGDARGYLPGILDCYRRSRTALTEQADLLTGT